MNLIFGRFTPSNSIASQGIPRTRFAFAPTSVPNDAGVVDCKFMATYAMGFAGIDCRTANSTQQVRFLFDRFQMIRIHARTIATNVIQFFIRWDWASKHFKRNTMRPFHRPTLILRATRFDRKFSITQRFRTAGPYPTCFGFRDLGQKTFLCTFIEHMALVIPQGVM